MGRGYATPWEESSLWQIGDPNKSTVRAKRYALKCAQRSDSSRKLRTPAGEMPKIESENGSEHQKAHTAKHNLPVKPLVVGLSPTSLADNRDCSSVDRATK